jgi:tRNA 2-thiocytidine biosynthesis protein TtcA
MSFKKTEKQILRKTGKAISDYGLIEDGDRIMVAVSGGKDSYTLLHILELLRKKAPIKFSLLAVNIDPDFSGYKTDIIENHLKERGYEYKMVKTNIYDTVEKHIEPNTSYCSFCSRLRRGVIYNKAAEFGCTKIALGHHLDDFIETLLLNQFFTGEIKAMSAKLLSDDKRNVVIRPLVNVEEELIIRYAAMMEFPVVCCCCPVCGSENMMRKNVKSLLNELSVKYPGIKKSMLKSLSNINTRHLLDKRYKKHDGTVAK